MPYLRKRGLVSVLFGLVLIFASALGTRPQALAAPGPAATAPAPEAPQPGSRQTLTLDGVEFTFCYIPAGAFMMGSPESETGRGEGEKLHKVIISQPFYMMENEVTQEQYAVLKGNDSYLKDERRKPSFPGAKRPIESIFHPFQNIPTICDRFAAASRRKLRLPTRAEWEYACRAGTSTPFHYGNDLDATMANFNGREPYGKGARGKLRNETTEVKQFKPNAWGLYDMHGNVAEICLDYAPKDPDISVDGIKDPGAMDPEAIAKSGLKPRWSFCGGGYNSSASECRASAVSPIDGSHGGNDGTGFRLVLLP